MSGHTPGPWTMRPEKLHEGKYHVAGRGPEVIGPDGVRIVRVLWLREGDNSEADARLIAAAPEEHAALKRLTHAAESFAGSDPDMPSHTETEEEFDAALTAAYRAIAQAEGLPPPGREK